MLLCDGISVVATVFECNFNIPIALLSYGFLDLLKRLARTGKRESQWKKYVIITMAGQIDYVYAVVVYCIVTVRSTPMRNG